MAKLHQFVLIKALQRVPSYQISVKKTKIWAVSEGYLVFLIFGASNTSPEIGRRKMYVFGRLAGTGRPISSHELGHVTERGLTM
jgi:hypothetical protein